jgi:glycine hydroxymethyltransferase
VTRGSKWKRQVVEFFDEAVKISQDIKAETGSKLKDFKAAVDSKEYPAIKALKAKVEVFAKAFPTIGFEKKTMRYTD